MKNLKYTIAICLVSAFAMTPSFGQALKGSYFIDRSIQRTSLNPAFSPESNYISLPVLSGVGVGINSSVGMDDFLYYKDNELYTYLNKNVSYDEVASKLTTDPTVAIGADTKLFGLGLATGKRGYLSVDVDLIVGGDLAMPKDLFLLTKMSKAANETATYDLSNLDLFQITYGQVAVAYKYDFSDLVPGLSIGARAKYAALVDAVDVTVNKAEVYMSEDKLMVNTDADGYVASRMIAYDESGKTFRTTGEYTLAGGGFLFDFGAEYKLKLDAGPLNSVNISASVTDIGSVSAKSYNVTKFHSAGAAEFTGLSDIDLNTDFETNLNKSIEDFKNLLNLEKVDATDYKYKFKPEIHIAAEAALFNNKLSGGLLYSNPYGLNELTAIITGKLGGFNASLSYNFITAKSFGFFLSYIPKAGVSVFLGSDCIPTQFTPQWIPINMNATARFGVSILFHHKDDK